MFKKKLPSNQDQSSTNVSRFINQEDDIRKKLVAENTLLRPYDVSKMIGVTVETLCVWRSTKRVNLKFIKIGKNVMYRLTDVNQFIAENSFSHTAESKKINQSEAEKNV